MSVRSGSLRLCYNVLDSLKDSRTITETIRRLKQNPCDNCGNKFHPVCMDFDHVRGIKRFNISQAHKLKITDTELNDELDKCELICSNCHRLRTYYRATDHLWQ